MGLHYYLFHASVHGQLSADRVVLISAGHWLSRSARNRFAGLLIGHLKSTNGICTSVRYESFPFATTLLGILAA